MRNTILAVTAGIMLVCGCSSENDENIVSTTQRAVGTESVEYEIRRSEVRQALGSAVIKKAPVMKSFTVDYVPIINVGYEGPSPDETANMVLGSIDEPMEVSDRSFSLVTETEGKLFATNKASGFYRYSNKAKRHRLPRPLSMGIEKEELVNLALEYIVSKGIVLLSTEEELTIESVGSVRNATYEVTDSEEPILDGEALMGYTIVFGRMYGGIPIIGSQIRVHINMDRTVQGFDKYMRPILSAGDNVTIISDQQIRANIETERSVLNISEQSGEDEIICGYIEAGMLNQQSFLQPGCYAFPKGRPSLRTPILVPAVENLVEPLRGERN